MKHDIPEAINIAVLNTTHIGTTLCDFPLYRKIQKAYPKAKITIILCKRNGVLKNFLLKKGFNVIVFENNFVGLSRYKILLNAFLGKYGKYDLAVCGLEPRKTDHLFLRALSKNCIAYGENNWHSKLIKHIVKFDRSKYEEQSQAEFSARVFSDDPIDKSEWPVLDKPKSLFPELTLLIQTSNNRDHSILSYDRMATVLNRANSQIPFNLIINIIEENKYLEGLKKSLSFSSYEVVKTQNFEDFLSLINNVDLTLLGDGGASHVSALTNTPSLILFGKTSSTHWTPIWGGVKLALRSPNKVDDIEESLILSKLLSLLSLTRSYRDKLP